MSQETHLWIKGARFHWALGLILLIWAPIALAQERPVIGEGEITGNDVYVRSGPSLNHYTICKLNAGERVKLLGSQGEWMEILPPEQAFSLISGEYVDTADNKTGVVNGNNVRVRAGSALNKNKYTVQTMLKKGAEVTIIGQEPDGFLRIVPPPGATLWISKEFVEPVPDKLVRIQETNDPGNSEGTTAGQSDPEAAAEASGGEEDAAEAVVEDAAESAFASLPPTWQRQELERLDAAAKEEMNKPLLERDFDSLLTRYGKLAEQDEDQVARQYAQLRIKQINRAVEASAAVRKMREMGEQSETRRREYMTERMTMSKASPLPPSGLDAEGELRESALYPPGSGMRRYRLVDTSNPGARTIGYVEIPQGSSIDVQDFLGRYVGVRASKTELQTGAVDPVPIYTARELVLVRPGTESQTQPE